MSIIRIIDKKNPDAKAPGSAFQCLAESEALAGTDIDHSSARIVDLAVKTLDANCERWVVIKHIENTQGK
ncbi:hypothetical protein MnTg02_00041 [bacterium MnTg02]|nr:hypothetical protein MnTg02_00041 [bacterium MnTg02]